MSFDFGVVFYIGAYATIFNITLVVRLIRRGVMRKGGENPITMTVTH